MSLGEVFRWETEGLGLPLYERANGENPLSLFEAIGIARHHYQETSGPGPWWNWALSGK